MDRDRIIIEADELLAKIDNSNLRIYDATIMFFRQQGETTAYEQYQQGHIPGAAFFDHLDFSDSDSKYMFMVSSEAALAESIGKIGISADSEVVLYAINVLPAATRAWWLLRYAGHDNVRILNGGLAAWQAAGGQVETGINQYAPTTFETKLRPHMFVNKENVQAAMDDPAVNIEYTLDLNAYNGNYIPGSSVYSAMDLMQAMQSLKPNGDLTSHISLNPQYERTITYCGGGIAATVNAIAHLIAGNEQVAVYDGSLTEWMGEGLPTANASDDE